VAVKVRVQWCSGGQPNNRLFTKGQYDANETDAQFLARIKEALEEYPPSADCDPPYPP